MSAPSCLVLIGFKKVFEALMLDSGGSIRAVPRGIAEVTRCIMVREEVRCPTAATASSESHKKSRRKFSGLESRNAYA